MTDIRIATANVSMASAGSAARHSPISIARFHGGRGLEIASPTSVGLGEELNEATELSRHACCLAEVEWVSRLGLRLDCRIGSGGERGRPILGFKVRAFYVARVLG